ncbi:hypothetical protein GCM10010112_19910 [Actinoplanes lobatus]|uniref:PH domain-containing protein n=1 Tax=Actinoplanes lobatus TaxID=113568 RepID=A0A7W7ML82_9ACTN|nr:hypothetical protein [Actinoplanes lobatus]MBB4754248.1 hypothetical protein [Actinoplanes lobatus]GGN62087.1 hypothetical protein GCM10010112_19910 [Actinoplanes lobatus]GIE44875.1 hypothetical protein Alo02nite_77730 [Actinoplanes lobatus]
MKITLLTLLVRWRAAVLLAALLAAVAGDVALARIGPGFGWILAFGGLGLVPLLAAIAVLRSHRPAILVARPGVPAFDVPVSPGVVLVAVGWTLLVGRNLSGMVRDLAVYPGEIWLTAVFALLWAAMLGAVWAMVLRGAVMRLRPDGIEERRFFGSLLVPWSALETPRSALPRGEQQIALFLADPKAVRRRGLRSRNATTLTAIGVDAEFLARAVHEYANRPDLRPAIGSPEELSRFLAIPQIARLSDMSAARQNAGSDTPTADHR